MPGSDPVLRTDHLPRANRIPTVELLPQRAWTRRCARWSPPPENAPLRTPNSTNPTVRPVRAQPTPPSVDCETDHAGERGGLMLSLEKRYAVLTATARKLGHAPDLEQLRRLCQELDQRSRTTVPAGERRYQLSLASREANSCLTEAADRAQGLRAAAAAAAERECGPSANSSRLPSRNSSSGRASPRA